MPEQPLDKVLGSGQGFGKDTPWQMEKGAFPPRWAVGCAPTGAVLQDLPCVPTVTPEQFMVQVSWMGTRSDGKMEPHTRVDTGYRRERLI